MEQNHYLVQVAVRGDGCVGYFELGEHIPVVWEKTSLEDISHIMSANKVDVKQALAMLNRKWRQAKGSA